MWVVGVLRVLIVLKSHNIEVYISNKRVGYFHPAVHRLLVSVHFKDLEILGGFLRAFSRAMEPVCTWSLLKEAGVLSTGTEPQNAFTR